MIEQLLTAELKKYIKASKHIETGRLVNTAKVIKKGDGFALSAPEYINYLDDGEFVNNFFKMPSVMTIIQNYLVNTIINELNEEIDDINDKNDTA